MHKEFTINKIIFYIKEMEALLFIPMTNDINIISTPVVAAFLNNFELFFMLDPHPQMEVKHCLVDAKYQLLYPEQQ